MDKDADYLRLVRRAQRGDRESLDHLTRLAQERLSVDVYRLTLRHDLAQEIVQETLIEMFKVLGDLKEAHKFWPWLYKIALNKLRLHHRREQRRKQVTASVAEDGARRGEGQEVMADVITGELRQIVVSAMRRLAPRQRAVLTMRCYREMDYSEIGESMDCSEFAAKMLFYRAKKSLRKELSRHGFGRGMLLTSLIIFGKITAPSEAAVTGLSVTAATTKVGVAAGLAAYMTSKTGILSLAAAGALAVGTTAAVKSVPGESGRAPSAGGPFVQPSSWTAESSPVGLECWYYYPRGSREQVMLRLVRRSGRHSYCQWLENDQGSYFYDRSKNRVHVRNHRMWNEDLSVLRLPADDPAISEFISSVEGPGPWSGLEPVRGDVAGLVVVVNRNEQGNHSSRIRHYNASDEQYFLYDWPTDAVTIDDRDAMHRRGWTYFRISGEIDGRPVTGAGRIPFVYGAGRWNYPWLELNIGGSLRAADNGAEARIYSGSKVIESLEGGSFFKGLGRPWTGLHTIDTVRRDAAARRIPFETIAGAVGKKAKVVADCGRVRLTYTIDLELDVVEEIAFSDDAGERGRMVFSYLQDVEAAAGLFIPPGMPGLRTSQQLEPESLWLARLIEQR